MGELHGYLEETPLRIEISSLPKAPPHKATTEASPGRFRRGRGAGSRNAQWLGKCLRFFAVLTSASGVRVGSENGFGHGNTIRASRSVCGLHTKGRIPNAADPIIPTLLYIQIHDSYSIVHPHPVLFDGVPE